MTDMKRLLLVVEERLEGRGIRIEARRDILNEVEHSLTDDEASAVAVPRKTLDLAVALLESHTDAAKRGRFWGPASHVGIRTKEMVATLTALSRDHVSRDADPPTNRTVGPETR